MNNLVQFNNHNLEIISKNGQRYFSAPQVGAALGYARSDKITQIYNRHIDEFTPDMSDTLKLRLSGNLETEVRVFSLRGCHLLAMFSKTPVAKEFRRWVLDLIEQRRELFGNSEQLKPIEVGAHTRSLPSRKKEIVLSEKAKQEIGGIFKRCATSAISKSFDAILTSADKIDTFQDISDKDLIRVLYNWYAGRHKDWLKTIQEQNRELDDLRSKLLAVKTTVNRV